MSDLQEFLDHALEKIQLDGADGAEAPMEYDIFQEIAESLIAARTEAGLTQEELAKRCGVSQANISKFETGSVHPSLATLKKVADGLGKRLSVSFLDCEVDD